MSIQVDTAVRGPEAYALARDVIAEMEKARVWPTPLNFEIWLHYLGDPDGALGREIKRLLAENAVITEETSEMLAAEFLPRGRLSDEIRDAGAVLDRELATVASAIARALVTQRRERGVHRRLAATDDGDAGTGLYEAGGDGQADAAGGTGDDCALAGKIDLHAESPVVCNDRPGPGRISRSGMRKGWSS